MTKSLYQRTRRHQTRWTVRAADKAAKFSITVGGIGTILAVSAVFLFLLSVVVPIFLPGSAEPAGPADRNPARWGSRQLVRLGVDEYRVAAWALFRDGALEVFRLDNGEPLETHDVAPGDSLSAWSFAAQGDDVALGFTDGTVRLGRIGFATDFPGPDELPSAAGDLAVGAVLTVPGGVVEKTPEGQYRRQRLVAEFDDALASVADTAVVLLDHVVRDSGPIVCALSADGTVHLDVVEQFENLMTGEVEREVRGCRIELGEGYGTPVSLVVSESGTAVRVAWRSGRLVSYDTRDFGNPRLDGEVYLIEEGGGDLDVLETLLGGTTFLAGDHGGRVRAWFRHQSPSGSEDDFAFSAAREFSGPEAPVTTISSSPRSRVFAVGYQDGHIRVYQATSGAKVLDFQTPDAGPVEALVITPKDDGLVALTSEALYHWDIDLGHAEATLASLFLPVWYEGYDAPEHVWQSSSATDDFEPKLGMWPLIFGTLKATVYSMLFAIPLALLAAIFTSEFMPPMIRPRVKTLIESMASLPSVVLGFLAALVFAPFVQRVIPAALVGFLVIPGTFLVAAYLWQLLPNHTTLRLARFRLWFLLALLPVGFLLAAALGPWVEDTLFERDIILWLDGQRGSGIGGWLLMLLPLSALGVIWAMTRFSGPLFNELASRSTRSRMAAMDLARFSVGAVLTLGLALLFSWILELVGLDPRGSNSILDTYVQRNALVVGFVMGFAVIPIIYTIAEDALSAVPDHLRAASLGAGATPWQTAIRIVLPAAMSGLFSAVMIGLGRAVGETMIVLMAAGNTPVLEMNIFNGFRTLSANIAVELPEAVRDSTHYRTLFLAAFILFLMTFSINTIAETVRLRFRRRSSQI